MITRATAIKPKKTANCFDCLIIDFSEINIKKIGTAIKIELSGGRNCAPNAGKIRAMKIDMDNANIPERAHYLRMSFLFNRKGIEIMKRKLKNGRYGFSKLKLTTSDFPIKAGIFPANFPVIKLPNNKSATTQNSEAKRTLTPKDSALFSGRSKIVLIVSSGNLFFKSIFSYPKTRVIIQSMVIGLTSHSPLAEPASMKYPTIKIPKPQYIGCRSSR